MVSLHCNVILILSFHLRFTIYDSRFTQHATRNTQHVSRPTFHAHPKLPLQMRLHIAPHPPHATPNAYPPPLFPPPQTPPSRGPPPPLLLNKPDPPPLRAGMYPRRCHTSMVRGVFRRRTASSSLVRNSSAGRISSG